MICPHCGRKSDPLFKFCLHCGRELDSRGQAPRQRPERKSAKAPVAPPEPVESPRETKVGSCPSCSADLKASDKFCPGCGAKVGGPAVAPSEVSPSPAAPAPAAPAAPAPAAPAPVAAKPVVVAPTADSSFVPPVVKENEGRTAVGFLISVSSVDGNETVRVPLYEGANTLGRGDVDIQFGEDDLLSPVHLSIEIGQEGVHLACLGSRNGSFVRMIEPVWLEHLDMFRIGQQLLRYEELEQLPDMVFTQEPETQILGSPTRSNPWGRLTQVVDEDQTGSSFLLSGEKVFLGRERGNITFPGDRYVSGTHAVLTRKDGGTTLNDVGSSNGTYVRVKGGMAIRSGQFFLAGRQLFKLHMD